MGTPVLAFDIGAHREVVRGNGDGILIPEGDAAAFAAAMRNMVSSFPENAEVRNQRAEAARERFQRGRMIQRLVVAYEEIRRSEIG